MILKGKLKLNKSLGYKDIQTPHVDRKIADFKRLHKNTFNYKFFPIKVTNVSFSELYISTLQLKKQIVLEGVEGFKG